MENSVKLGHVHLKVKNLTVAESFYVHLLGLKVTERVPPYLFLSFGKEHHDLALKELSQSAESPTSNMIGLYHVAFEVSSEEELGVYWTRIEGMRIDAKFVDHGISKAIYFKDPDGNGLEIYLDTRKQNNRHEWGGLTTLVSARNAQR